MDLSAFFEISLCVLAERTILLLRESAFTRECGEGTYQLLIVPSDDLISSLMTGPIILYATVDSI